MNSNISKENNDFNKECQEINNEIKESPSQVAILSIENNIGEEKGMELQINNKVTKTSLHLNDDNCWNNPMLAIEKFQIFCKEFIIKYKQIVRGCLLIGILLVYHLFLGKYF